MAAVSFKMQAESVLKGFQSMIDITQNLRPLLSTIVGEKSENAEPWTLRGSVAYSIKMGRDVSGSTFEPLNKKYKARKDKEYSPDLPILFKSGSLFESLVYSNAQSVEVYTNNKVTYGTMLPYGARMNFGFGEKNPPARQYMGFRKGQDERIGLEVRKYLVDAFRAKGGA